LISLTLWGGLRRQWAANARAGGLATYRQILSTAAAIANVAAIAMASVRSYPAVKAKISVAITEPKD
jgi:hypothetical protein